MSRGIVNKLTKGTKSTTRTPIFGLIPSYKTKVKFKRSESDYKIRHATAAAKLKARKVKKDVKRNWKENKDGYKKGAVLSTAGLAIGVGIGHKINKHRESKTIKGRVKRALGR
jgi:hypothetical protein